MDPKKWTDGIRQLVSKKKRRHKELGFDLDLSYITTRIIAMGFPSTGNEGIYRNHAEHVTEFLRIKHGEKVKVYNLCSERDYPVALFNGRVAKFPFDDHNPPPMQMFLPFCEDAKKWLDSDPENVIAIHCKAGKGRTGVMICAYLLYIGEWDDADECMSFYGFARTLNGKGVTIPSQKRFIRHFADLCRHTEPYFESNVGALAPYVDEVDSKFRASRAQLGNGEAESASDEEDSERNTNTITTLDTDPSSNDLADVVMSLDINNGVGDNNANAQPEEVNSQNSAEGDSKTVVTPKGTVFRDYSDTGSNLEENLQKARVAANASKVGRRPTYAQASFWMSSHQDMVHQIFLDSGVPGGLLGVDHPAGEHGNTVALLEDLKPVGGLNVRGTSSVPGGVRVRGEVLPPVVLGVVEIRLSSVPSLNIRGSFQPVFRIQGAGYSILSTDFLPRSTYSGKGAMTFAIPGINVVDEVLFTIYNKTNFGKDKIAQFWLHTAFIKDNRVVLTKPEIDKINKDKRHKKYPSDFNVEIVFDEVFFEVDKVHADEAAV